MHILTHTPIFPIFPIFPILRRNKNASTAATQMGFSVLPRPYALVLGSHEDDISMTEGVVGLKEQISIGFIELSEDIAQRLPVSIDTTTTTTNVVSTYPPIYINPSISIHSFIHT